MIWKSDKKWNSFPVIKKTPRIKTLILIGPVSLLYNNFINEFFIFSCFSNLIDLIGFLPFFIQSKLTLSASVSLSLLLSLSSSWS